jgi:hypothetical protein
LVPKGELAKVGKYILEVYKPGSAPSVAAASFNTSADDCVKRFESDRPFMSIAKGDLLEVDPSVGVLRVSDVAHLIWEDHGETKHMIQVFTGGA